MSLNNVLACNRFFSHVFALDLLISIHYDYNVSDFKIECVFLLCTYRLNWNGRTSWEWSDSGEWNDTALRTQDLKFDPWQSEAEHAASRSRRLPTILNLYEWAGNKLVFLLHTGASVTSIQLNSTLINRYITLYLYPDRFPFIVRCELLPQFPPHNEWKLLNFTKNNPWV